MTIAVALFILIPTLLADDALLYKAKCAMCHGADGAANGSQDSSLVSDDAKNLSDAQLPTWCNVRKQEGLHAFSPRFERDDIKAVVAQSAIYRKISSLFPDARTAPERTVSQWRLIRRAWS